MPLAFLRAAHAGHAGHHAGYRDARARFETRALDVTADGAADYVAGFDVVVAADVLYDVEVAACVGDALGAAVADAGAHVIVADAGRRARDDFLAAFGARLGAGANARFRDWPVPAWCDDAALADVFDGSPVRAVGLLEWDAT